MIVYVLYPFCFPLIKIRGDNYPDTGGKVSHDIDEGNANKDESLINLTKERKKQPLIFVSYTGKNSGIANKCGGILLSNGYKVKKYNPDGLWDDPAGEVVEAIETSNVFIYVSGNLKKTDWIMGEINYSDKYDVPFFEFKDNIELEKNLNNIKSSSKEIDLIERLSGYTHEQRYKNVLDAFEKYIDEDVHGSEWVSSLNMIVKTGGDTLTDLHLIFLFFLGSLLMLFGLTLGVVWMIFY